MNIVTAKCPNCGATLKINSETNDGVCQYCGTPFFTQEAISYYNMTVVNNTTVNNNQYIAADNVNIISGNFENLYTNAIDSWNAKDYEDAYNKFTKALEINPDDNKCALFKALCLALLKRNISGATSVYKRIFTKLSLNNKENLSLAKTFLEHFNVIAIGIQNCITNEFTTEVDGTWAIERAWNGLEQVLDARLIMVSIAEKIYSVDTDFKNNYIVHMKNLVNVYNSLVKKWKRLMPLDYRYHVSDVHPRKEEFLREKDKVVAKIRELEPEYEESKKGGCYIATCVYGSYDCPQVWTLRRYRDYTLDTTWYGRLFIKIYYAISPTLVKLFGKRQWFQNFWKKKLDKKIAKLQKNGVEDSPYQDKY